MVGLEDLIAIKNQSLDIILYSNGNGVASKRKEMHLKTAQETLGGWWIEGAGAGYMGLGGGERGSRF